MYIADSIASICSIFSCTLASKIYFWVVSYACWIYTVSYVDNGIGYLFFVCLLASVTTPRNAQDDIPITEPLPRDRELSKLVSDHFLADLNGYIFFAIMHHELQTDEIGYNRTGSRFSVYRGRVFQG